MIKEEDLFTIKNDFKNHFISEQLILLDNGSFKKVKVTPGPYYPEHLHPDKTEFVYVLCGTPLLQIGTNVFEAKADEFYIFPRYVKHSIRNHSNDDCILLIGSIKSKNIEQ